MHDDGLIFDRSDPEPTNLIAAPGDDRRPILVELGTGVFALVHESPRFGNSNIGLVIDDDGLTVIDTAATPVRGKVARQEIESLTAELGLPIKRVVITSSRVPFTGGSALFWRAAFHGSEPTSDELDQPANLHALRALLPELAVAYHDGFETRPITHTIDETVWLTPATEVRCVAGEGAGNLVVVAPGTSTVFLGALGSFGVTPLAFAGDPAAWASTLHQLADLATTFVPGHGPVGGRGDVETLAAYFDACVAAAGDVDALADGPWEGWTDRRFDAVNVERAARLANGDQSIPTSMFELLGLG